MAKIDKAVEIKPDKHEAWDNRGYALTCMGRYQDALKSFDIAIEINPNYANAYYNKAVCYTSQANISLALENLQRAISLDIKYRDMAKTDKDFDQIREDVRFQSLLERV